MSDRERSTSRRDFVRVGATACLGVGVISMGCAGVKIYQGTLDGNRIALSKTTFSDMAGSRKAVIVEVLELDAPIVLLQKEDGSFYALSARCTHEACIVSPEREFIYCTCHGSTFDKSGEVIRGPAEKPLTAYAVKVEGDDIHIVMEPPA